MAVGRFAYHPRALRRGLAAAGGVLLLAAGCGRPSDFSGPAPIGGLQCALEHGQAAGYESIEGSVDAGFLRLSQRLPGPPAERIGDPQPDLADVVLRDMTRDPVENQILLVEERGRLQITVLGLNQKGARIGAGSNAEDQARTMLALCTTIPPTFPGATGGQTPPRPSGDP